MAANSAWATSSSTRSQPASVSRYQPGSRSGSAMVAVLRRAERDDGAVDGGAAPDADLQPVVAVPRLRFFPRITVAPDRANAYRPGVGAVHGVLRVSVRPGVPGGGMGQPGLIMTRCGAAAPRARSRVRACGVSTKVKDVQPNVKSRASRVSRWRHPQPSREVFMHQLQLGNRVQDLAASALLA